MFAPTSPTVAAALRYSAQATLRNGWLAPVGLVVMVARFALAMPAQLFVALVLPLSAAAWVRQQGSVLLPFRPWAAVEGVLAAATSPRFLAIAAGLWLAGALLAFTLRVAYLAGALPSLAGALARAPGPRFAAGFVHGFVRLLPAAVLALALRLVAWSAFLGALAGTLVLAVEKVPGRPALAAALGAAALAGSLLAALCAGALADALLARVAIAGERPLTALARAARRFRHRPAAFLAVALAALVAQGVLAGSVHALATVAGGRSTHPLVLLGPQLFGAVLAALVVAAAELWRLGANALLACGGGGSSAAD